MIEKRYCLTPEEWAYAKAELVLAEKLGLIENADIEALEKRCAEKNEENARLEMEKKVFYGPRRYSLPMYLQYELTRFRLDFVQPTENIRKSGISPEITENQKKAFYERNKDLFGRYFGDIFSYDTFCKYRKPETFDDRLKPNRIEPNKLFEEINQNFSTQLLERNFKEEFMVFYNLK